MKRARVLWSDRRGTTAIEYALIAMGIFLAIIISVDQVGTALSNVFAAVAAGLPN